MKAIWLILVLAIFVLGCETDPATETAQTGKMTAPMLNRADPGGLGVELAPGEEILLVEVLVAGEWLVLLEPGSGERYLFPDATPVRVTIGIDTGDGLPLAARIEPSTWGAIKDKYRT